MALNLGELYVQLSVRTEGLTKGLQNAAEAVEKTAKKMAEVGEKIAGVSAVFTALGGVMVAEAAKYSQKVGSAVDGLRESYSTLAVQIGTTLVPVIEALSSGLTKAANVFASLSPGVKDLVVQFGLLVVAAGPLAAIGGKVSGLVGAFAEVTKMVIPLLPVLASVALAVGAIWVAAGILRTVWDENFGGIQEKTQAVFEWIRDAWDKLVGWFRKGTGWISEAWGKVMTFMGDALMAFVNKMADLMRAASRQFGLGWENSIDAMVSSIEDLRKRGLAGLVDDAKEGLGGAFDAFKRGAAKNMADVKGLLKPVLDLLDGKTGKAAARARTSLSEIAAGTSTVDATAGAGTVSRTVESLGRNAVKTLYEATKPAFTLLGDAARYFGGTLRSVVDAFGSGAAAGGVAGGIGAAVAALIQRSEGFSSTVRVLEQVLGSLANVVGAVLVPLQPLIGSLMGIVEAVGGALQPAFQVLASILEPFLPVIVVVGELLKVIAPALGMFIAALQIIQNPMILVASKAMPLLFEAIKFFGGGILKIVRWIAPVWNAIAGAVMSVVRSLISGIQSFLRAVNVGGILNGAIAGLESLKPAQGAMQLDMVALTKAIQSLEGLTWDAALAKAKETAEVAKGTDAQKAATQALRQLGEELTNVPTGFKVAAAQYAAIDAAGGLGGKYLEPVGNTGIVPPRIDLMDLPATGAGAALEAAAPAAQQPAPQVYVSVQLDSRELANSVATVQENKAWQRTGERRRMEAF